MRTVKAPKPTFYGRYNTRCTRVKENGKVKYVPCSPRYHTFRALTDAQIDALDADYKEALNYGDHLEPDRIAKMQRFRKLEYM